MSSPSHTALGFVVLPQESPSFQLCIQLWPSF